MPRVTRLMLVDDHAIFRESMERVLSREADIQVVRTCGSVDEALELIQREPVDLVLLDYELAGQCGSEFLPKAREAGYNGRVIVVTAAIPDFEARRVLRQGAAGIFLKEQSLMALLDAIRAVMSGVTSFDERYMRQLLEGDEKGERFSDRERSVIRHIIEGLSNKQIASRLNVSEASVKASLQRIFEKTGVRTRSHLVRVLLEHYRELL